MNKNLRNFKPEDSIFIDEMLVQIPEFDLEDKNLAIELLRFVIEQPNQKDYIFLVFADSDNRPVGFACYGPTPLTKGTFDLYWIAVNPAYSGQGIGTFLLKTVEERIMKEKGRMLVIETSSDPKYARTRNFYLKNGYVLAECLHDFYQDGEDRVTYTKRLL